MAVRACLILNFEGQISPVVPPLLDDLHMSLKTYGMIGAVAVAAGAISAAIAGRLADRWGRTALLVVRDFSPRLGRATAFAFWTWGPIGANFLAAGLDRHGPPHHSGLLEETAGVHLANETAHHATTSPFT